MLTNPCCVHPRVAPVLVIFKGIHQGGLKRVSPPVDIQGSSVTTPLGPLRYLLVNSSRMHKSIHKIRDTVGNKFEATRQGENNPLPALPHLCWFLFPSFWRSGSKLGKTCKQLNFQCFFGGAMTNCAIPVFFRWSATGRAKAWANYLRFHDVPLLCHCMEMQHDATTNFRQYQ